MAKLRRVKSLAYAVLCLTAATVMLVIPAAYFYCLAIFLWNAGWVAQLIFAVMAAIMVIASRKDNSDEEAMPVVAPEPRLPWGERHPRLKAVGKFAAAEAWRQLKARYAAKHTRGR